jgi:hypothetical protein
MTAHPVVASRAQAGRGDLSTGEDRGECEIATSLADSLLATTGRGGNAYDGADSRRGNGGDWLQRVSAWRRQFAAAKTAHDKATIQRQIDATDQQIDRLVYELYGLTEAEITIVEAGTKE